MKYAWATRTDNGKVRDHNEDSVRPVGDGVGEPGLVVALADGMGGHVAGEVASRTAIEAAMELVANPQDRVLAGNDAVLERVSDEPRLAGMGTTLTLVEFAETAASVGHVGDSRGYLLRDGDLCQITRDHSLVADLVESGELAAEAARYHPYRSVITRALGLERIVAVDTFELPLEAGDRLLLCSDGLTDMVFDSDIGELLGRADTPGEAAEALIERANEEGGHDNISVVVVFVNDDD